jgi:ribonuclease D
MKLPKDLKEHFPHTALIIASDQIVAKFFLVGGDELEELDSVALPRELRQDSEGEFISSDGSRTSDPDSDLHDTPRKKQFVKKIAERIKELVREHAVAHVHLVMLAEMEHLLSKHLEPDVKKKVVNIRHYNLMKEGPLDIARKALFG